MARLPRFLVRSAVLLAWNGGVAAAAEAVPAPAFGQKLLQVLGGLAMVLLLVGVLAWLAKRLNGSRFSGARHLRLVGGLSLGARERILVVEVGTTQLVLGVAPGRVQTLHVLDSPLPEGAGDRPMGEEGTFAARLARFRSERRAP